MSSLPDPLRNIRVLIPLLPLHIILLNQPINIPLNIRHRQYAPTHCLGNHLRHQLRMRNRLAALHDAHNRRLALEITVLSDADMCFLVLLFSLLELDLVDFDAILGVREVGVDAEGVCGVDFAAAGSFEEGLEFGACEGLKGTFYFGFGWDEVLVYVETRKHGRESGYLRSSVCVRMCS